jgi:murein L,D-transpeptidase YafK
MRHPNIRAFRLIVAVATATLSGGCDSLYAPPPQPVPEQAATPPAPAKPPTPDRVVVLKSKRVLELRHGDTVVETFPIALGAHSRGPKRTAGDGRTPEGVYRIDRRSLKTRYSRELHISYPNGQDRSRAEADHADPGGGIFIHGMPRDFGPYDPPKWERDWTEGCIAVGNAAIVKIWDAVPDGTPIDILP